jgi:hypothetical protein
VQLDQEGAIRFGVITPVGSDPIEAKRLEDLIDSLEHYEVGRYLFVMVNDGLDPSSFRDRLRSSLGDRFIEIENPRRGRGNGWAGGGSAAVLAGLKLLAELGLEFVLKIDTDALVIGPFSEKVGAIFESNPRIGMIGNVSGGRELCEDGLEHLRQLGRGIDKLMRRLTIWRKTPVGGPRLQVGFFGGSRVIRDTLRLS